MLRGFRHTLFLLLQIGIVVSGAVAVALWPDSWPAVLICVAGASLTSAICERIAGRYLQRTLGRLRRLAADIGHGRPVLPLGAHPGEDFYKLVSAINLVAERVAEAGEKEEQLQAQLRRSEKLAVLGELAANVAHEINNPLDGVQNCARILRRSAHDPQRARQMLDLIDGGLARIELIVRRLLTLARQHVIRRQEADVGAVVEAALTAAASKLDACGIRVIRKYDGQSNRARIDPPLLEQAFANLFLNAVDSMPAGGELTIAIACEKLPSGAQLRIDVSDTGTGIPPDVLPHVFEPFFTTKRGGKGTGLGLPIAARIVDAHGGTICASSHRAGATIFTVRIPVEPGMRDDQLATTGEITAPPATSPTPAGPTSPLDPVPQAPGCDVR